ncbi:MAG: O-antigen ligase family protein, partial [Elusimicrobia bacterium]|nr:O-antigen ligase family protein [Elusimicrobiota bacterium]
MAALKKEKKSAASPAAHPLTTLGLCLVAAGVPLAWSRFVADEYILPEVVVLSAGLLIAAIGTALSRPPSLSTELDRPVAAVLIAWTLAAVFSIDPRFSALGTYGGYTYGLWQVASCAAVFQLTACAGEKTQRRIAKAALAAAMLAGAYALLQAAGLDPLVAAEDLPYHRAIATLASPVFLGAYLALWLPVALHWSLGEPGEEAFGRGAAALIGAGLMATVSRGAWLGAAVGAAVYLRLTGRLRAPRWTWSRWAAAAAAAGLAAAWSVHALAGRAALSLGKEQARVAIWGMAGRIFMRHPWLGVGPDAFEQGLRQARSEDFIRLLGQGYRLGHAHNEILQVLATTGLIGLGACLWLIVGLAGAARKALASETGRARAAGFAGGLAALFVNVQFNIVSLPAFVSAALAAGMLCRPREDAAAARRLKAGA